MYYIYVELVKILRNSGSLVIIHSVKVTILMLSQYPLQLVLFYFPLYNLHNILWPVKMPACVTTPFDLSDLAFSLSITEKKNSAFISIQ